MAALVNFQGLQVVSPDPSGDGGLAIQNDLKFLVQWSPKSVWNATSSPAAGNDSSQNFYAGSLWLRTDTTPMQLFLCLSPTPTAAVWVPVLLNVVQDSSPKLGGDLDVNGHKIVGAVQIGSTGSDTLNLTASNVSIPNGATLTKTAQAGTAETLLTLMVSDDTSFLRFKSNSAGDANFAPTIEGFHSGANVANALLGTITTDTGANPCLTLTARVTGAPSTEVVTRPILQIINRVTVLVEVSPNGNLLAKKGAIGYGTGAGGTITQSTSKSTGVTLNKPSGQITLNNAALAADTTVSFTLTNSAITATDVLVMNHISGGTAGSYLLNAQCASGSASINVRNITSGSLSEAIVIQFVLVKGSTS